MERHGSRLFGCPGRNIAFYGGMVLASIMALVAVRWVGGGLAAPASAARVAHVSVSGHGSSNLFQALLALAVIIVTARAMGALFSRLRQPAVIGEVFGGILLGPSLLGHVAPQLQAQLLPAGASSFLNIHSQIGVILYLFLVGLELDLSSIRKSGCAALAISHASILLPFVLGSALALVLYPVLSTADVPFLVFALFVGVSLSVTAFPVLARILTDRDLSKTEMGALALTCAAVDDVTAWCLLALVVSISQSQVTDAVRTILLTLGFVLVVLRLVAPLVRRLVPLMERPEHLTRTALTIVFAAVLGSAMATEYIGIHGFFGAFLFGAIVPHGSRIAGELNRRLEDVVAVLFLPAFFAFTGMRTEIGLIGAGDWLLCGLIIAVACLGKFGGTLLAARFSGLRWRDSAALGVLMNTRGLVELIVLNMGLDLGILSPRLFTMLVIMAVVTTFLTTPVLQLLLRKHPWVKAAPATLLTSMGKPALPV